MAWALIKRLKFLLLYIFLATEPVEVAYKAL